jgi:hypothetical protein
MNQNKKNVAHSIFQRLLNRAKTNKEDFNLLLSRYGMRYAEPGHTEQRLNVIACCLVNQGIEKPL